MLTVLIDWQRSECPSPSNVTGGYLLSLITMPLLLVRPIGLSARR